MRKIDEIYIYLNENSDKEKRVILKGMAKRFSISDKTSELYYYRWKKDFMNTPKKPKTNLQPNQEKKVESKEVKNNKLKKQQAIVIKGEYGIYIKEGNKVISGDIIFEDAEEIEEYKKKEIALFYRRLSEIMDVMNLEV